jgi:uncharacterized phage protein (TIGR02218 family)
MKIFPPALQAHLDSGATTLAWCWKLARRDGVVYGFTDHDRTLAFDGTIYEATTGFTATEIKDSVGLSIDNLDVESALTSNRLDENDLAAGLYDDAAVEIWRVNWSDTAQRVLMRKGSLGEVRRAGRVFSAEVRGLAHYLNQPQGRLYQYGCDATLGDARCTVALSASTLTAAATIIAAASPRLLTVAGIDTFAADWFTRGLATFTSGANANQTSEIRRHSKSGAITTIDLWQPPAHAPLSGDTLTVSAGCDKTFVTCRAKFANGKNFRGFPHMPGNDFVMSVARPGAPTPGAALR